MDAITWVRTVGEGDSDRQIAVRAGIPIGTFSRQLSQNLLTPHNIVLIARAYRASPLDGLVAVGLITKAEVRSAALTVNMEDIPDEDIVRLILQRILDKDIHPGLTEPLDDTNQATGTPKT